MSSRPQDEHNHPTKRRREGLESERPPKRTGREDSGYSSSSTAGPCDAGNAGARREEAARTLGNLSRNPELERTLPDFRPGYLKKYQKRLEEAQRAAGERIAASTGPNVSKIPSMDYKGIHPSTIPPYTHLGRTLPPPQKSTWEKGANVSDNVGHLPVGFREALYALDYLVEKGILKDIRDIHFSQPRVDTWEHEIVIECRSSEVACGGHLVEGLGSSPGAVDEAVKLAKDKCNAYFNVRFEDREPQNGFPSWIGKCPQGLYHITISIKRRELEPKRQDLIPPIETRVDRTEPNAEV